MDKENFGIQDNIPESEWDDAPLRKDAIDVLKPESEEHRKVIDYLCQRLEYSERKMSQFYARWAVSEKKLQAYVTLEDWEETLKVMNNDKGKPPKAISVIVPFSFATIQTIVTFLLHAFAGRRPIFPVSTYKGETADTARIMETVLQYNADHTRFIKELHTFLQDGQVYGVGIFRTAWEETFRQRTRRTPEGAFREESLIYQGNMVRSQDPYMFFPDPRVPMAEVNRRGEFVFWRTFEGRHAIKHLEADGIYKWVDAGGSKLPVNKHWTYDHSSRSLRADGDSQPGMELDSTDGQKLSAYIQVDQGTCEIIPAELGLGEGTRPEKWLFTILNKKQIVQAEPYSHDHSMHPVCVTEPYTMGYGFGHIGMADMIGPIQDLISWMLNARIDNVRRTLNDMFIVDPNLVELADIKNPGPGKLIRLKRPAIGQDVRTAISQLPIQDVTANHVSNINDIIRFGQMMSSVQDNVMGIQDSGGRKTATEVRTAMEAGASRLSAQARIISAQAMVDLTEQMAVNIQQFQTEEFMLNVVGEEGINNPILISPEMLVGDFHYPVHDGTIPIDKVALLDVWKEIFAVTAQDPDLTGRYDRSKIFEFMAELGGAKNIEAMKLMPDEQLQQQVAQGNLVPLPGGQGSPGPSPLVQALGGPPPAQRAAE